MVRSSFNADWYVLPAERAFNLLFMDQPEAQAVTLPYDCMLNYKRTPDADVGASGAFYPSLAVTYQKDFQVPEDWDMKWVVFEFEGVYRDAMVYINGGYAGGFPYGYSHFFVEANNFLKYGQENQIKVIARTANDSRWYSGAGIYRNVNLLVSDAVHIVPDSYQIRVMEVDDEGAIAVVSGAIRNISRRPATICVETTITDGTDSLAAAQTSALTIPAGETEMFSQRLYLEHPQRWELDSPHLYTASSEVKAEGQLLDQDCSNFGIRTLALDPKHGLRINGKSVKLRGACIHHDNGLLGAASIYRAEERRVELLKQAGFNAIRSAHQPMSKALLDACDRIGMVVMDEVCDMWTSFKTPHDFSVKFPYFWESICERMVAKDFNHPSVILYSIGNEIAETGSPQGGSMSRRIAEKLRNLDSSRYILNAINPLLSVLDKLTAPGQEAQDINDAMNQAADQMKVVNDSELVTRCTRESIDCLDICGYNYAASRYELDNTLFPNRILVGSETGPMQIVENWELVKRYNQVIGDFTWTGWDYIGEAGVGRTEYSEDGGSTAFRGKYPWYIAYCGDIDITGVRRPMSYYREIIFGLRTQPYLAVDNPLHYGKTAVKSIWNSFDAFSGWNWPGYENKPVRVNVFGIGTRFTLFCNGSPVGAGALLHYRGWADIPYAPGELSVITYDGETETGRAVLRSAAGPTHLDLRPDRSVIRADDTDLCYIEIFLMAENGEINDAERTKIHAEVSGAGELAALGTGEPISEESFRCGSFTTFHGRALAIIRPTGQGSISLTVTADGLESTVCTLVAQ